MGIKLVSLAITITVSVIVIASVLIPAVNDATVLEKHDQASGDYLYNATTEFAGQTYSVSGSNLLYNGETIGSTSIQIISDHFVVIFYNGTLSLHDSTDGSNPSIKSLTINTDKSYSWVNSDDTVSNSTQSLEWFAGPSSDSNSNYVVGLATSAKMLFNSKSTIMGAYYGSLSDGNSTLANSNHIITFSGKADDLTLNGYIRSGGVWTETAGTIDMSYTDKEDGSYSLTGTTAEITLGSYAVTGATAYSVFVPRAYTTIEEGSFNAILTVIPVVVIISLVLIAAGFIMRRGE